MPRVGFEPTIPAFERTKTVLVLDREATVIDQQGRIADCKWSCTFLVTWGLTSYHLSAKKNLGIGPML
jgi:hypothetical protein